MFGLLMYSGAAGAAAVYTDLTAAVDQEFTQRNNHYTFTEPYELLASCYGGDDVTNGRLLMPSWNAIGEFSLWPPNISAADTILSPPRVQWFDGARPELSVNEELQAQITSTAAMAIGYDALWIVTKDWTRNLPRGRLTIPVRATGAVALTATTWSAAGAITLAQGLRGGVYAVVGASCFVANGLAFRLIFPRSKMYHGRKLRPGWLCNEALGDIDAAPIASDPFALGVWGYFHTFELPQIELFGNAAGAATQEIRLWLQYLGEDVAILNQLTGAGY